MVLSDIPRVPLSIDVYDDLTLSVYRSGTISSVRYTVEVDLQSNNSMLCRLCRYINGERQVVITVNTQNTCKFGLFNSGFSYNPNIAAMVGTCAISICTYRDGGWEYLYISTSYPTESIVLNSNTLNVQSTKTTVTKQIT